MKRVITASILLLILALSIPLLFMNGGKDSDAEAESAEPSTESSAEPELVAVNDAQFSFTALIDGEVHEVTIADYLPGVLAGEMPAAFEPEALKAQAIAARTYIMYCTLHENSSHPEAAVCNDATCCKAYLDEDARREIWQESFDEYLKKLNSAVVATDGIYLTYEGEPIQAVFHSSSSGMTASSGELWSELPYLISVSSPETADDVPNFVTTVEVTAKDFSDTILAAYPEANLGDDAASWIGESDATGSGRTGHVTVGGVSITGAEMRGLFELRSSAFTLEYDDESFVFTVTGYGHGVGMSQYGANVMAKSGSTFEEILMHYYPGAQLSQED